MLSEFDEYMLEEFAALRKKFPQKPVKLEYKEGCWSLGIGPLDREELWLLFETWKGEWKGEQKC